MPKSKGGEDQNKWSKSRASWKSIIRQDLSDERMLAYEEDLVGDWCEVRDDDSASYASSSDDPASGRPPSVPLFDFLHQRASVKEESIDPALQRSSSLPEASLDQTFFMAEVQSNARKNLEESVLRIQASCEAMMKRKDLAKTTFDSTGGYAVPYNNCYLYQSILGTDRQTLLLQSPSGSSALVVFSAVERRRDYCPLFRCSSAHIQLLETFVVNSDRPSMNRDDVELLCQTWNALPQNKRRSPKEDILSKVLRDSCSYSGNITIQDWLRTFARSLGGVPGSPTLDSEQTKTCPICLERLHDSVEGTASFRLQGCGHGFCRDCGISYIQSCPRGRLPCPWGGCGSVMGVADLVHITSDKSNRDGLVRVLSNELEQYCLVELRGQHCPSPHCGRLLSPKPGTGNHDLLHCDCGLSTICGKCGERAHPGVSCEVYGSWRKSIDSGKADDESNSLRYIVYRSQPCPKCGFPIEKNGGCNHVRCTKCQYYFCFQWCVLVSSLFLLKPRD